jgi:Tc5 transposase-like DNA-binding protein
MQQRLSAEEEKSLAEWCRIQEALGVPPSHEQIQLAAQRMLLVSRSDIKLGKRWIEGFKRRNPSICKNKGKRLEKARVKAVTPNKIKIFFKILEELLLKLIRPQNLWNVDDMRIMDGQDRPGIFIGSLTRSQH